MTGGEPEAADAADARTRPASADDLAAMRRLAAHAFDREPIQRAALVDLLYHRPPEDPALRRVAVLGGVVVGFVFGSLHGHTGYVDAIAVDASARRRGMATRLLEDLEGRLVSAGATELKIGENTWFYAWPGLDVAYTAAFGLFERAGYRQVSAAHNMDVALAGWIPGTAEPILQRQQGKVVVRRAQASDWLQVEAFIREKFTEVWRHEAGLAVHRDPSTMFIARRDGCIVAFGCHAIYRRDWFGPIATDPDERGSGIGEALLRLCLDDIAAAGIAAAEVCWIGPMNFYARTVDARCGREFAILAKDAAAGAST